MSDPPTTLDSIPLSLDTEALLRAAHVRGPDTDHFAALVETARRVGRPKALYRECFIDERGEQSVTCGGVTFTSPTLRRNLEKPERVFAFVATCGAELDGVPLPADDMLVEFWWDTIKAAALGSARLHLMEHLRRRYALVKTAAMSPGSGDADVWPIQQQRQLFALLGDVEGAIGVRLTPSCLMVPNKTVSGVVFPTETDFRTCQVCHRENCPGRAAPFDEALWQAVQHG